MKKWLLASLLVFLPKLSHASIQDPLVIQEKTYEVHFTTTVAASATGSTTSYFDLISISTTSGLFPHNTLNPGDIGELDISHIEVIFDKAASSSTTAKIGVATLVTPSTSSVAYFWSRSSVNNVSNTDVISLQNNAPAFYRCKVKPTAGAVGAFLKDGSTPFLVTNEKDSGTFVIDSTTTISSPIGQVVPMPGDIIMRLVNQGAVATVNYIVNIWYHAEP